jgi:hypothetical protein
MSSKSTLMTPEEVRRRYKKENCTKLAIEKWDRIYRFLALFSPSYLGHYGWDTCALCISRRARYDNFRCATCVYTTVFGVPCTDAKGHWIKFQEVVMRYHAHLVNMGHVRQSARAMANALRKCLKYQQNRRKR